MDKTIAAFGHHLARGIQHGWPTVIRVDVSKHTPCCRCRHFANDVNLYRRNENPASRLDDSILFFWWVRIWEDSDWWYGRSSNRFVRYFVPEHPVLPILAGPVTIDAISPRWAAAATETGQFYIQPVLNTCMTSRLPHPVLQSLMEKLISGRNMVKRLAPNPWSTVLNPSPAKKIGGTTENKKIGVGFGNRDSNGYSTSTITAFTCVTAISSVATRSAISTLWLTIAFVPLLSKRIQKWILRKVRKAPYLNPSPPCWPSTPSPPLCPPRAQKRIVDLQDSISFAAGHRYSRWYHLATRSHQDHVFGDDRSSWCGKSQFDDASRCATLAISALAAYPSHTHTIEWCLLPVVPDAPQPRIHRRWAVLSFFQMPRIMRKEERW